MIWNLTFTSLDQCVETAVMAAVPPAGSKGVMDSGFDAALQDNLPK